MIGCRALNWQMAGMQFPTSLGAAVGIASHANDSIRTTHYDSPLVAGSALNMTADSGMHNSQYDELTLTGQAGNKLMKISFDYLGNGLTKLTS